MQIYRMYEKDVRACVCASGVCVGCRDFIWPGVGGEVGVRGALCYTAFYLFSYLLLLRWVMDGTGDG